MDVASLKHLFRRCVDTGVGCPPRHCRRVRGSRRYADIDDANTRHEVTYFCRAKKVPTASDGARLFAAETFHARASASSRRHSATPVRFLASRTELDSVLPSQTTTVTLAVILPVVTS